MKVFKDKNGTDWTIDLTVEALMRVKELADVDLLDLEKSCYLMADDRLLQARVLYALCKPQCDERGKSMEQFFGLLTGEALIAAAETIPEEVLSFFPKPRREAVRRAMEKKLEIEAAGGVMVIEKIGGLDVQRMLRDALGPSSTSSPASAASTPARLPSGA
jgi:hypothetical protein